MHRPWLDPEDVVVHAGRHAVFHTCRFRAYGKRPSRRGSGDRPDTRSSSHQRLLRSRLFETIHGP
ncbi:hypothetical protein ALQ64_102454 [Pseudomonas cannabina]|uniref:Uncharacterized protein n=1 Tax=Pseudomonas cannabina TaxID=86840 RepID=A0A0P9NSY1_PSECA|nr:hypothetical protein ALO81_102208 [Pseudomonas cannabina]RMN22413.1 hypothetical protein ALQ64_102454 [Pseudomonas cannabina]